MASWRITVFCTVRRLFSIPRKNLNSLTLHMRDEDFCVEFGLIHDQKLRAPKSCGRSLKVVVERHIFHFI
eukprot:UN03947